MLPLFLKLPKIQTLKALKNRRFRPPSVFDASSPENPREYRHKPYTAKKLEPWHTFLRLIVRYRFIYISFYANVFEIHGKKLDVPAREQNLT